MTGRVDALKASCLAGLARCERVAMAGRSGRGRTACGALGAGGPRPSPLAAQPVSPLGLAKCSMHVCNLYKLYIVVADSLRASPCGRLRVSRPRRSGLGARVHAFGVCDTPDYFYDFMDKVRAAEC